MLLLTMAIRAGFEPLPALGSPLRVAQRTRVSDDRYVWVSSATRHGSKPARIIYRAIRAPKRTEFFALPYRPYTLWCFLCCPRENGQRIVNVPMAVHLLRGKIRQIGFGVCLR